MITILVAVLCCFLIWIFTGLFDGGSTTRILAKLMDGFFVVGVVFAGIGGLIVSYNEGVVDGLTYGLHGLFGFRNIKKDSTPQKENFYDYRKRKHAKKISVRHLVIVGSVFILIAVILYIVYISIK